MGNISGPRIFVLFGLLLLAAGVALGLPSSLAPAAVVIAVAAILVLFGTRRPPSVSGPRMEPLTSIRAAFGPAVDAMDAVAVYTVDRAGRIDYANRGARRELLAHMLRSRGADVHMAGDGREAVDAAASFRFQFVLLDLQMPEMDGFQVLRRLRALPDGDRLPVVALTALTSDLVKERCEAEGMNDFVSKPVTLARIGELVAKWGKAAPGATSGSGKA